MLGDYNNDGKVDAADDVMLRNGVIPLFNEVTTIGSNTPADYTEWRNRFGNGGSGAGGASVLEPGSCALVFCGFSIMTTLSARRQRN